MLTPLPFCAQSVIFTPNLPPQVAYSANANAKLPQIGTERESPASCNRSAKTHLGLPALSLIISATTKRAKSGELSEGQRMQEMPIPTEHCEGQRRRSLVAVLLDHMLLICGAIAWWGCHYLLLWNADVAATDALIPGYDGRFMLTVGGTVVTLAALLIATWRRPGFQVSAWKPAYGAYVLLSVVALGLVFTPLFAYEPAALTAVGAFLSGAGSSFALVMNGELHARMPLRTLPLVFALEILGGIALFLLFATFPAAVILPTSILLTGLCAACLLVSSRQCPATEDGEGSLLGNPDDTAKPDMGLRSLAALAILTGIGYGLVRTFTIGAADSSSVFAGIVSECTGTCCSALLLVAVFLLQKRLSLFELCLLFVVPLVATGLLLVSLRGTAAAIPTAINHGGFACFFVLMWYFASVLAAHGNRLRLSFSIALLFLASQTGQLAGSLVPVQFSNMLSMSLVYLILVVSMGFMYWRSKTATLPGVVSNVEGEGAGEKGGGVPSENEVAEHPWAEALALSPREEEIAALLLSRTPYRQISETLFISENTVKTHVRNIYKKAAVSSREELLEALAGFGHTASRS